MTQTYDAIVVGAGLTGVAIAYELQQRGQRVLLLEKSLAATNATGLSYGGILYWSGQTPLQQQLCAESRQRWTHLTQELRGDTEYRELDLLLYVTENDDPYQLSKDYQGRLIPPQFVDASTAVTIEPHLETKHLRGAFVAPQGQVHPTKTIRAFITAFLRLGGRLEIASVDQLLQVDQRIQGIATEQAVIHGKQVIVTAGALGRRLLRPFLPSLPLYFTHAYVLRAHTAMPQLRTMIMPANMNQRLRLEKQATDYDWEHPEHNLALPDVVLDPGGVEFLDGQVLIGQLTCLQPDFNAGADLPGIQRQLHQAIAPYVPSLGMLPSTVHHCCVAFTDRDLPLVGTCPALPGLVLFTGFNYPWVYVPPLAKRLARWLTGRTDGVIEHFNQVNSETLTQAASNSEIVG